MKYLMLALSLCVTSALANVVMETSLGEIEVELDHEKTPLTAANFEDYVKAGHYDGLIFHRVIKDFMIQGGGLTPDLRERPTNAPIVHEGAHSPSNLRGTIAMARTNDPNSATSQFFINVVDNQRLDYTAPTPAGYGYVVFGKVVRGMETVDKIRAVKTTTHMPYRDVPQETVLIQRAYLK